MKLIGQALLQKDDKRVQNGFAMAMPKQIVNAQGAWVGRSKLHLSWLSPEERVTESDSTLQVELGDQAAFATIAYTWRHEGQKQNGAILACINEKLQTIEYAWLDSWHQAGSVMRLVGPVVEGAPLKGNGTYQYEDQVWGWTIALSLTDEVFTLRMENVDPSGEAEWAVEAVYNRE